MTVIDWRHHAQWLIRLHTETGGWGGEDSNQTATACITGDAPAGASASTVTATQVVGAAGTSYINSASECDANTLFSGPGVTEWAYPDSSAPTQSTSISDAGDIEYKPSPGSTQYYKVVLTTSYANASVTPTSTYSEPYWATGTGSSETTADSSAVYGNSTSTTRYWPTEPTSLGTAISTSSESSESAAPYGNSTSSTLYGSGTSSGSITHTTGDVTPSVTGSSTSVWAHQTSVTTQTVTSVQTETLTLKNGTTTVVHTSLVPVTTTVDKTVAYTHNVTSYETMTLATIKIGWGGRPKTITRVTEVPVHHTETLSPPVSYRTKTIISSAVVTLPCSTKSCRKASSTSWYVQNTTTIDAITASCSTIPPAYVTKSYTWKITLVKPHRVITSESCDTYTVPPSTTWVYEPETSCPSNATITPQMNSTSFQTMPTISASTTSQQLTTSTIYATSVVTISQQRSTSLSTASIVASTIVFPVVPTPVAPVTAPQTSTEASIPVSAATTLETSAPASTPVAPVMQPSSAESVASQPSVPGSSPTSSVEPDTTMTTRIVTTLQVSSPVTVTATRPGGTPFSPMSQEQPSNPVSSEQPAVPVAPEQPSSSASPEQPASAMSPEQPYTPVAPEQPSSPVAPEQPFNPISPEQPYSPVSPEQPAGPVSPAQTSAPVTEPEVTPAGPSDSYDTTMPTTSGSSKSTTLSVHESIQGCVANVNVTAETAAPSKAAAAAPTVNFSALSGLVFVGAAMVAL